MTKKPEHSFLCDDFILQSTAKQREREREGECKCNDSISMKYVYDHVSIHRAD